MPSDIRSSAPFMEFYIFHIYIIHFFLYFGVENTINMEKKKHLSVAMQLHSTGKISRIICDPQNRDWALNV